MRLEETERGNEHTRGLMRTSYRIARWSQGTRKCVPSPTGCIHSQY